MPDEYETNETQYQTVSILGECCQGIGTVYLAKHLPTGEMVAVKRFNMDRARDEAALIQQEIILTRQLNHPNIIKYLVAFVNGHNVCVVSPLMGFRSCRDIINLHFNEGLTENAIAIIMRSVIDALDYIHKRGIIHRSIRASHVLVSADGHTCLSGFRYSCPIVKNGKWQRKIHSFPSSTSHNLNWLSPELLEQNLQGYNEKSDIYSLGMLLCELANGSEPFAGVATTLMLTEKARGYVPPLLDCTTIVGDDAIHGDTGVNVTYRKQASRRFSDALHEIAHLCLQQIPYERPPAGQLLTHPYFKALRRTSQLCDWLRPAIPVGNNVTFNSDELESVEIAQKMSDMELFSCDWNF